MYIKTFGAFFFHNFHNSKIKEYDVRITQKLIINSIEILMSF